MKELQNKQKNKRLMYSLPSIAFVWVIAIILLKGTIGVINKNSESKNHLENLENKVTALALREKDLSWDIDRLETQDGVKDEIRDRFSVTEEGEHVAIIVDDKRAPTSTSPESKPWYERLWNAIIGDK